MAYSLELRIKIVEAYEKDEFTSQQELADFFNISLSTLKRWLKRKKAGEPLTPKVQGKGRPAKIDAMWLEAIKEFVEKNPTITLGGLSDAYYKKYKVRVGTSILFR